MKAYFPIFIKILAVLLAFGIIPLMIFSLLIISKHNQTLDAVEQNITAFSQSPEILTQYLTKIRYDMRIRVGSLLALFVFLDIIAVYLMSRGIARPMGKFVIAMERLSKGIYGTSVKIFSRDEFSILAHYFNLMSGRLKDLRSREKWVSRAKSRLLGLAAHQLRTPLTGIQWTLTELIQGSYDPLTLKQKGRITLANKSAWRMIHLINSLLTLTRIEEGKFNFSFKKASIINLVQEMIKEMKERAEIKQINLELDIKEENIPEVYFDKEKIKFVFENLISNAIQYTQEKGSVYITLDTGKNKQKQEQAIIAVADTGIGMTKEEIKRLFTQFHRSKEAMEMYTEGSGLGLFISRNIINAHGGKIWAESKKGEGTTFFFTLPITKKQIPKEPSKQFILGE